MTTTIIAHAGEEHEEVAVTGGFFDSLTHLPAWASLLIIAFVLFGVYVLLEKLKIKPINRILLMIPLLIIIAIIYLQHNPLVSTVVLSLGFVASFAIAFVLLGRRPESKKDDAAKD